MTTTAGTIMPVRTVDDISLGAREGIGPISAQLHDLYWEKRWSGWHGTPVRYGK